MRADACTSRRATLVGLFLAFAASSPGQTIPITWDEAALASMQTPLRDPSRTPKHMPSEIYNRMPAIVFYKTYPIYAPGREPAGYMEQLRQLEPQIVFDPARLRTAADW